MLQSFTMTFDGHLLNRGFWLYVWQIKGPGSLVVYVGRTGDSSSAHASSPFKRIGQHLDPSPNAKGNALGKQLTRRGIQYADCTFEMVAIGPLYPEQTDFDAHVPLRNQMAAFERAVADELKRRRYDVLGTHPRQGSPDPGILAQILALLDQKFPPLPATELHTIQDLTEALLTPEDFWICAFCGKVATLETIPQPLCESRTCPCGAIALANRSCDYDEITDDAIGLFSISVRPESHGYDQDLRQDILRSGVDIKQGVSREIEWFPGHREQIDYVWFRRSCYEWRAPES